MFDVDDTLVMWDCKPDDSNIIFIPGPEKDKGIHVRPHTKHVELVKNLKGIGWYVVVWSQGGADHASRVVEALQLQDYVDLVMSKPECIFDDLPWEDQYIKRKYLEE